MPRLLHLTASARRTSLSTQIATAFTEAWSASLQSTSPAAAADSALAPTAAYTHRNLTDSPVPPIREAWTTICDTMLRESITDISRYPEAVRTPPEHEAWRIVEPLLAETRSCRRRPDQLPDVQLRRPRSPQGVDRPGHLPQDEPGPAPLRHRLRPRRQLPPRRAARTVRTPSPLPPRLLRRPLRDPRHRRPRPRRRTHQLPGRPWPGRPPTAARRLARPGPRRGHALGRELATVHADVARPARA